MSAREESPVDWIEFVTGFIAGAAGVLLVQAFTRLLHDPV